MSWIFSRALMDSLNSLSLQESGADCCPVEASESEPSVPLSVMPTLHKFYHNDKMMDLSKFSRFGLMYQVLEESLGEELLTLYRGASLVKTSASRVSKPVLKVKGVDSGQKWSELLAKYDPDMCLWKTSQRSLLEDLESSLEIFPKCGMTRNGAAYQRPKLGQITDESVFGFYVPTPTASDGTSGSVFGKEDTYYKTSSGTTRRMTRTGWDRPLGLGRLVNMWSTPTTMDKLPPKSEKALLREATVARPGRSRPANLRDQVSNAVNWPTPTTRDYKGGYTTEALIRTDGKDRSMDALPNAVLDGLGTETKPGYQLSADWTEWLMGFPVGWSDLEALPGEALPWDKEPEGIPRVVKKQNHRALRLRGIGNAQVPQCAAEAYLSLLERLNEQS